MRRTFMSLVMALAVGALAWGQLPGGFSTYPGGHLLMVYQVTSEGREPYTYTLELTPREDGSYLIRTEAVGPGSLDDLATTPFFMWSPSIWLTNAWWLPYYYMLFIYGQTIEPNRTYVLPGGLSFVTEGEVTVAGVAAVKGTLTAADNPDERVILAISPNPAVPYPVWVRQERKTANGWELEYEMLLTQYQHG